MKKPKSISLSKMLLLVGALFAVNIALAIADDVTRIICVDFENDTIGTPYPDLQDATVDDTTFFYIRVEEDPVSSTENKALHLESLVASGTNYVLPVFDITLPRGLTVGDMDSIVFDLYVLSENSSYNNFRYYVLPTDGSWKSWGWSTYECDPKVTTMDLLDQKQENKNKWISCSIAMSPSFTANSNYETLKSLNSFQFSIGEENSNAHYYIDNIGFSLGAVGEMSITSAGYATYYVEEEYTMPDGVTGTTVTGMGSQTSDEGYYLTMPWEYGAGTTVPAKTALVLKGDANTYTYAITSNEATASTDNLLLGSTSETETTGPNGETTGYVFYELTNGSSGIGFYYGKDSGAAFTSAANKAWLPLSETQARNAKFLGFGEGDTTGITSVENEAKTVKGIYTLQGVKVSNMSQPGIYIVDGRKVLVK